MNFCKDGDCHVEIRSLDHCATPKLNHHPQMSRSNGDSPGFNSWDTTWILEKNGESVYIGNAVWASLKNEVYLADHNIKRIDFNIQLRSKISAKCSIAKLQILLEEASKSKPHLLSPQL